MVNCERFVNSRFTSNTYVISHTERDNIWIVDPGDVDVVFEWMKVHSKTTISGILLTHAHFDHIYGINDVLSRYPQCIIYVANNYGRELLSDPKRNGSKYTEEGPVIIKENARIEEYYEGLKLWNDMPIEVLYTPGHSDDSVCFIIDNMLFTGDTLIKNVRTVTKLKSGSKEKLNETLRQIEKFKGQSLIVYPGHEEIFALDVYDLRNSSEMLVASIANIKN